MEIKKIIATEINRIDKFLANSTDYSRNDIQQLIDEHQVYVNDILVRKASFKIKENDQIEIKKQLIKETNAIAQNINLDIVFENEDFLIINKRSGMVVHPAPGNMQDTLVNALLFHFKNNLSNINGEIRPGIVHRIDKDTSGLLLVAKTNEAHNYFALLLKKHQIERKYQAIIVGKMDHTITNINLPIGRNTSSRLKMEVTAHNSKEAFTKITSLKASETHSLIQCELKTGRTHQIRVHLAHINKPIYGDNIYGKKVDDFNQRLHAYELSFTYKDNKQYSFNVPLPKEMQEDLIKFNLT
ncbi:RluA family pseudouridine synthase [[Mycoplasma] mobile]|uniref:Pseudouridine synthase n=1 Tax=Mycoplasma mobile (strain ATCC 43663 / 163K / NCTC 11711) TaxID=267748 RepID=Q6KHW4_MYCM1|nr:RluA family pseudouridine synthase [[Mycoplasma] mobile]AAT27812.1 ribosomal large subunit pseudouridine synthase D [Mycoplasma mobile 163K]